MIKLHEINAPAVDVVVVVVVVVVVIVVVSFSSRTLWETTGMCDNIVHRHNYAFSKVGRLRV